MPFKKIGKNKYKSPKGRIMTLKQVQAYYAKKGKK
jgi:Fe-S oxidoreductase